MDDIIDYISKGNLHAPIIGKMTILVLLFVDDLAYSPGMDTPSCKIL
jgi:hypothetical protein